MPSGEKSRQELLIENQELRAQLTEAEERTAQLSRAVGKLEEEALRQVAMEQDLREANDSLKQRAEQLKKLASGLTLSEQRERNRIAGILHDAIQQLPAGAEFHVGALRERADEEGQAPVSAAGTLPVQSIELLRLLARELSPPVLESGGLAPSLRWLVLWMGDKHGMAVELECEEEVVLDDESVRVVLFQAVQELLLNVLKHAQVRTARVRLSVAEEMLRIVVEDDGAGFDPAQVFARSGASGAFGLFSIRERIGMMGGCLEIDSAPGKGSRFMLLAPIKPPAAADWGLGKPGDGILRSAGTARRKIRVLLVDDHAVARQAFANLLEDEPDMEIVGQATTGEAAIRLTEELEPDVVLMDINMPDMNGIDATRRISRVLPRTRVIGLSMREETDVGETMRRAGAAAYLSKSASPEDILAAIRRRG